MIVSEEGRTYKWAESLLTQRAYLHLEDIFFLKKVVSWEIDSSCTSFIDLVEVVIYDFFD